MDEDLLSAGQAAAYIGTTRQRLDEVAAAGRIKRLKVGRNYVYRRADLDAYKVAPKRRTGRPKSNAGTMAQLSPALRP